MLMPGVYNSSLRLNFKGGKGGLNNVLERQVDEECSKIGFSRKDISCCSK